MFPENIVAATFQQAQTKYVTIRPKILKVNDSLHLEMLNNGTLDYVKAALEYNDGINVLGQFEKRYPFLSRSIIQRKHPPKSEILTDLEVSRKVELILDSDIACEARKTRGCSSRV